MDYTPTTDEVREKFAESWVAGEYFGNSDLEARAEFDRWLAARDREVAARAWQEGAQWAAVELGEIRRVENQWITDSDNPYRDTPNGD